MKWRLDLGRHMVVVWIVAAAVAFAASLYFMGGGGGDATVKDALGPSSFSRSALGYAGLAELLKRHGVAVVKSRYDSAAKRSTGGIVVLAEPPESTATAEAARLLLEVPHVLIVLPKWAGIERSDHDGWLGGVAMRDEGAAEWALNLAAKDGRVIRLDGPVHWRSDDSVDGVAGLRLGAAPHVPSNDLVYMPAIEAPVQLMEARGMRPVVAAAEGILLGEIIEGKRLIWILSDPDVLANHGIGKGENAAFAVALFDLLTSGFGNVVFDETVHGFLSRPASPFRLLFQFPFVIVTVQGLLGLAVLLWATTGRFGAPEAAPPRLSAGKEGLIRNAAGLLAFAGYQSDVVRRYVDATVRDVARRIHAPRGLSGPALIAWLGRVGTVRKIAVDVDTVSRRAEELGAGGRGSAVPLVPLARDIHRWKQEITDAASGHTRAR